MKRFKIIGTFEVEKKTESDHGNLTAYIPLIDEDNRLLYGIDTVVKKMEKKNIYPSELTIIPDPDACEVELPPNSEFTLYSTVIPTIEGNTLFATDIEVFE